MTEQNNQEINIKDKKLSSVAKVDPHFASIIRNILVDFIVNGLNFPELASKYSVTEDFIRQCYKEFKFADKKADYDKKVLDKVLAKAQKQHAEIIAKITKIVNTQVNRICKMQEADPTYIISDKHMRELLASLTIFTKEHRLDNNLATDNSNVKVLVEFGSNVPVITENHNKEILAEFQDVTEIVEDTQDKEKIETVENIDKKVEEENLSNSDLFGYLE